MKEMKRVLILYVVNAVVFGACGVLWGYQGFFENPQTDWNSAIMSGLCLPATILWIVRAVRTAKQMQQQ